MICKQCGKPIDDESAFCPYCGTRQAGAPAQNTTPPPPPGGPVTPAGPAPAQWQQPAVHPVAQPTPPPAAVASPPVPPAMPSQTPPQMPPAPAGGAQAQWQQPPPAAKTVYAPAGAPAPVVHKLKTKTDTLCGIVFLVLGIGALVYFILLLTNSMAAFSTLFADFSLYNVVISLWDTAGLQRLSLPLFFTALGSVLAIFAGLTLTIAGIMALANGKGRKWAYSAVVLMLFTLFCDFMTLFLMVRWGTLPQPTLGATILSSALVYLFEIAFVVAVMVLLPLKKAAKKKQRANLPFGPAPSLMRPANEQPGQPHAPTAPVAPYAPAQPSPLGQAAAAASPYTVPAMPANSTAAPAGTAAAPPAAPPVQPAPAAPAEASAPVPPSPVATPTNPATPTQNDTMN